MNNEQDEDNSQNNPNDFGSDPDVPIIHIPPAEHPHHPTIKARHRYHYIKRSKEFIQQHWPSATAWSTFGTLVTAFATIWMVVVYIQIKGIMGSQGGQTDKLIIAANTQARAAQKIADASDRNAKAAEDFATSTDKIARQQRAWIGILTFGPEKIQLQNFGSGVALNVTDQVGEHLQFSKLPPITDMRMWIKENNPYKGSKPLNVGTMFPGEPMYTGDMTNAQGRKVTLGRVLGDPLVKNGTFTVYVYGEIIYFTLGQKHTTHICGIWIPNVPGFDPGKGCSTYTDAD
jgi:hypothetical protein